MRSTQRLISRLHPPHLRPPLQQHRREALRIHDEPNRPPKHRQDQRDPARPAPAQFLVLGQKATDNRAHRRAQKGGAGIDGDGDAAVNRVPEVGERAADDGEWRGAEEAREEAACEEGREVGGEGGGHLEDGEDGEADDERRFAAVELGEGAPDDGAVRGKVSGIVDGERKRGDCVGLTQRQSLGLGLRCRGP